MSEANESRAKDNDIAAEKTENLNVQTEQDSAPKGCFLVHENKDDPFDISCDFKPDCVGHVPEDQQKLYAEVEAACTILRNLADTEDSVKKKYFKKLLSLSQVGLVLGETSTASVSLEYLKHEVLIGEGARIKNLYMKKLGKVASLFSAILFLLFLIDKFLLNTQAMSCISLIGIGTFSGAFISFGARKFDIRFEELSIPEKDMMNPVIRLLYTFIATLIFSLLLFSGVVELKIGSLETASLLTSPVIQLTIGAVCGLIESRIGVNVYNRATSIIGN